MPARTKPPEAQVKAGVAVVAAQALKATSNPGPLVASSAGAALTALNASASAGDADLVIIAVPRGSAAPLAARLNDLTGYTFRPA